MTDWHLCTSVNGSIHATIYRKFMILEYQEIYTYIHIKYDHKFGSNFSTRSAILSLEMVTLFKTLNLNFYE